MNKLAIVTTMVALAAGSSNAATIQIGSFENPGIGDDARWLNIVAGDPGIDDWTVRLGSVDLVRDTYWETPDGSYSIDVNGNELGGIATQISDLVVGQWYQVTFAMAGNPTGNRIRRLDIDPVKYLQAHVGLSIGDPGRLRFDYTFDTSDKTLDDMGWVDVGFSFQATATEMLMGFTSRGETASRYGAAVDNVRISEVPLPASALLLLGGLGGLAAYRRKKTS